LSQNCCTAEVACVFGELTQGRERERAYDLPEHLCGGLSDFVASVVRRPQGDLEGRELVEAPWEEQEWKLWREGIETGNA
jgi:hypothetical protein